MDILILYFFFSIFFIWCYKEIVKGKIELNNTFVERKTKLDK